MSVIEPGTRVPFTGRDEELERLRGGLRGPARRGVVITGARGVGKSRLAGEFLDEVAARHRTVRLLATEAAAGVPLSAFAPLLPAAASPGGPDHLFREVRRALAAPAGAPRTVLLVDDAHHLDASSLALLSALAADPSLFLMATLPHGAEWPEVFRALWHQDALDHLRLHPFDRTATERLLHGALGAPVAAPAVRALWEVGRGNALWTRELLRTAVREGALRRVGGVWCLTRPLEQAAPDTPPESPLSRLPGEQRTVLRLLALCGPVGLDDALSHLSPTALAELEEQDLVTVTVDGRRQRVALAHPWHALLLRHSTPRVLARRLLLEQAARIRAYGARRDGDALALARWELDATGTADPELLVRAAGQALDAGDVESMCRFAGAALDRGPHVLAGLMLGEALGQRGDFGESIPVLERAFASARSPEEVQAAAAALSQHHLYGRGDSGRAHAVLEEAADRVGPLPALTACRATLLSAVGRNREAAGLLARQPLPPDAAGHGTVPGRGALTQEDVLLMQAHMRVRMSAGRVEEAVRTGRDAYAVHRRLAGRWTAYYPARSLYLVAAALLESGRPDEAERTAREGQEAMRDAVPALTVWFAWVRGRIALERGRVADSLAHFREARALAQLCGQSFAEQRALAGVVLASAHAGRVAPETGELAPAASGSASPLCQSDTLRARGWVLRSEGRTAQARHLMLTAARDALAREEATAAAALLHDLVRWGDGEAAADLRAAAARIQGPLAAARAAHAAAVAEGPDAAALESVADRMEEMGLRLYAAEALATAAGAWRRQARGTRATRAAARSLSLRRQCQDPATPALAEASAPAPLSTRERDIALMAARGCTSREIAEACVLSVRTVENHLGRVYRKLGIAGRAALAGVLLV
jgi:DNA-binding NarL/FixJ family response regulator